MRDTLITDLLDFTVRRCLFMFLQSVLAAAKTRIFIISECISSFFQFCVGLGSDNNIAEEDIGAADDEEEESDNNNNVPRGINRLSCKITRYYLINRDN